MKSKDFVQEQFIPEAVRQMLSEKNIYQRINQVMGEVHYIQKGDKNAALKYSFVSHDAVCAALHNPMKHAGIVMESNVEFFGKEHDMLLMKIRFDFVNVDKPEDRVTIRMTLPVTFRGVPDEKSFGSALSYATKYALLKTFMLETGEDVDSDRSSNVGQINSLPDVLDAYQLVKLKNAAKENEEALAIILGHYKIDAITEIPAKDYDRVMKHLLKKKADKVLV